MRKTAIFVEGQTELIFVREMLIKLFGWQDIKIACYNLFRDTDQTQTHYTVDTPNASYYFEILNVGNDNRVLPAIIHREKRLLNGPNKFDRIIGLRDMYSTAYREEVGNHTISPEINQRFLDGHQQTLRDKTENAEAIFFHFAIMEVEAWFLGFRGILEKVDPAITPEFLKREFGYDWPNVDPETHFFHPAKTLAEILGKVGRGYDKKSGQIHALMSHLDEFDFLHLKEDPVCQSFTDFMNSLDLPV